LLSTKPTFAKSGMTASAPRDRKIARIRNCIDVHFAWHPDACAALGSIAKAKHKPVKTK